MLTSKLGRDFWLYRLGQFVSSLGDMCSTVALAWWVLNRTGSGKAMAAIMAPAIIVKIMGGLLLGPIGDRFSRKKLVSAGNFLSAVTSFCFAMMFYADHFNVAHILAVSCLSSFGSAIFASGSTGLVASIVPARHYHAAVAQTKLLSSISSILGGVFGGVAVTCIGIGGAFIFDGLSFIVGGVAAALISQNTIPQQDINMSKMQNAFSQWKKDFCSGMVFIWELRVILYISLMLMTINLLLSPLAIILPIMVRTIQKMPPWYFGVLETSVGAGALMGAGLFSHISKRASNAMFVLAGFIMIGGALLLLSWLGGLAAPVVLLGCMGMGMTIAMIPLSSQAVIAIPDSFRSRFGAASSFLIEVSRPVGLAASGLMVDMLGINFSLGFVGVGIVLLSPLMLLLPNFTAFINSKAEESSSAMKRWYPNAYSNV